MKIDIERVVNKPFCGGKHILVVDDDQWMRQFYQRAFGVMGFNNVHASDYAGAVGVMGQRKFEVLLANTDIHDDRVIVLVRRAVADGYSKIILCTGNAFSQDHKEFRIDGIHVISKPLRINELKVVMSE